MRNKISNLIMFIQYLFTEPATIQYTLHTHSVRVHNCKLALLRMHYSMHYALWLNLNGKNSHLKIFLNRADLNIFTSHMHLNIS